MHFHVQNINNTRYKSHEFAEMYVKMYTITVF